MATVQSKTSSKVDELLDPTLVSARISDGSLYVTSKGGIEALIGSVSNSTSVAVATGNSTTDTAAIAAAIATGSKIIHLTPSAVAYNNTTRHVLTAGQIIEGHGATINGEGFRPASNCKIRDITFNANGSGTVIAINPYNTTVSDAWEITSNTFIGYDQAVQVLTATGSVISQKWQARKNVFSECRIGFNITAAKSAVIEGNDFYLSTNQLDNGGNIRNNVVIFGGTDNRFINNHINGGDCGIHYVSRDDLVKSVGFVNNTISGNVIENTVQEAIALDCVGNTGDWTQVREQDQVSSSAISSSGVVTVTLNAAGWSSMSAPYLNYYMVFGSGKLSGHVYKITAQAAAVFTLEMSPAEASQITASDYALIMAPSLHNVIADNMINTPAGRTFGIALYGACFYNTVTGNTVRGRKGQSGIVITTLGDVPVATTSGPAAGGASVTSGTRVALSDNNSVTGNSVALGPLADIFRSLTTIGVKTYTVGPAKNNVFSGNISRTGVMWARDTFARADNTPSIDANDVRQFYSAASSSDGTFAITGSQARLVTMGTDTWGVSRIDTGHIDGIIRATLLRPADDFGIVFRCLNGNSGYLATPSGLYKVVGGTRSTITTWTQLTGTPTLRVVMAGNSLSVYNDTTGDLLGSTADTFRNDTAQHGFGGTTTQVTNGQISYWSMSPSSDAATDTANVKDFGAVGDGLVDDTAALHAARDSASIGGEIFVSKGTYLVTGLTLSLANQRWRLAPGATIKLKNASNATTVNVTADGIVIEGGIIDGNRANQTSNGYGILANSRTGLTVRGVTIQNTRLQGIYLSGTSKATIDYCTLVNCSQAGNQKQIYADDALGSYSNIRIRNCTVDGSTSTNGGIQIASITSGNIATDVKVTGNTVTLGINAAPVLGIEFYSNSGGTISEGLIADNTVIGPSGGTTSFGISLGGIATSSTNGNNNISVTGNTIKTCKSNPSIELIGRVLTCVGNTIDNSGHISVAANDVSGGSTGIVVSSNTIRGCTNTNYAIALNSTSGNPQYGTIVTDNNIESATGVGLTVTGYFIDGTISDNTIRKPAASGIIVNASAVVTSSVISRNNIDLTGAGANSDGINIASTAAADLRIEYNIITAAPRYGIQTYAAVNRVTIAHNTVRSCGSHGIYTAGGGSRFVIERNEVHDNTGRGISVSGSPTLTILRNNITYANTAGDVVTSGTFVDLRASVRDFGAVGDGVTDDTTAIHNARSASGVGGIVFFPPGTYLSPGLTANLANQTWELAPGASLVGNGSNHVVNVTASEFTIRGGKIDIGSGSIYSGVMVNNNLSDVTVERVEIYNGTYAVRCKGATGPVTTRLHVRQCHIHDTASHGVFFNYETTDSDVIDCDIHDVGGNGIWIGMSSIGCRIEGNHVTNSDRNGIEVFGGSHGASVLGNILKDIALLGISMDGSDGVRVSDNKIDTTGSYGIDIAACNTSTFADNTVIRAGSIGISLSTPSGTCNDNIIAGNLIDRPTSHGIVAGGASNGSRRLQVIGNTVIEPGNGAGSCSGIGGGAGLGIESWSVQGNIIRFTTNPVSSTGINVGGPNHLIDNNLILFDSDIATPGGSAITLTSTNTDCKVSGNTIIGNGKCSNAITINSSCTTCLISDNKTVGTTTNAIQNSSASTTNVIDGNMCQTTSGAAITFGGAMGGNRLTAFGYIDHTGPTRFNGNLGFYGTTPIAKPEITGSRASNAALASILTQLASLGLITDSTTA